jgi:hypothetical protein
MYASSAKRMPIRPNARSPRRAIVRARYRSDCHERITAIERTSSVEA